MLLLVWFFFVFDFDLREAFAVLKRTPPYFYSSFTSLIFDTEYSSTLVCAKVAWGGQKRKILYCTLNLRKSMFPPKWSDSLSSSRNVRNSLYQEYCLVILNKIWLSWLCQLVSWHYPHKVIGLITEALKQQPITTILPSLPETLSMSSQILT